MRDFPCPMSVVAAPWGSVSRPNGGDNNGFIHSHDKLELENEGELRRSRQKVISLQGSPPL